MSFEIKVPAYPMVAFCPLSLISSLMVSLLYEVDFCRSYYHHQICWPRRNSTCLFDILLWQPELKGVPTEMVAKLIPEHARKQCVGLGSQAGWNKNDLRIADAHLPQERYALVMIGERCTQHKWMLFPMVIESLSLQADKDVSVHLPKS